MVTVNTGIVFDIKKFSIHDGPGIRTTIFLKGCPLHCSWCHNPEGISPKVEIHFWEKRCIACHECVDACEFGAINFVQGLRIHNSVLCQGCGACAQACPTEAVQIIGTKMSVDNLMGEIKKDIIYYDQSNGGVTFSGGEPLVQDDFLEKVLIACQDYGIHTTVDTAGYVQSDSIFKILPYTDLFLYDMKFFDSNRHFHATGVHNEQILTNLELLVKKGAQVILRIPIIPGVNDDDENINQTGIYIKQLNNIKEVNLLPYHRTALGKHQRMGNHYSLKNIVAPTESQMCQIAYQLESYGCRVTIGG